MISEISTDIVEKSVVFRKALRIHFPLYQLFHPGYHAWLEHSREDALVVFQCKLPKYIRAKSLSGLRLKRHQ